MGTWPANTLIEVNHRLNDQDGRPMIDTSRYQRLVGKLIYLSLTRLDIAYVVGVVSQFMHTPRTPNLEAAYRISRYLKSTLRRGLLFVTHEHMWVEVYTDANLAGSVTDRRSTSGYCYFVGGNLMTWKSKKAIGCC